MQSEKLIQELIEQTRIIINQVEKLKENDLNALGWRENSTSWNILECIEHLNLYGDYYLPLIEKKLEASSSKNEADFRSGILGNYFAKSMLPKEKLNAMKTFKDKNPLHARLDKSVFDRCLQQQILFLELLNRSRNKNINAIKIEISIAKWIKLKLGDTFQFIINHILRHLKQIEKIEVARKIYESSGKTVLQESDRLKT